MVISTGTMWKRVTGSWFQAQTVHPLVVPTKLLHGKTTSSYLVCCLGISETWITFLDVGVHDGRRAIRIIGCKTHISIRNNELVWLVTIYDIVGVECSSWAVNILALQTSCPWRGSQWFIFVYRWWIHFSQSGKVSSLQGPHTAPLWSMTFFNSYL